MLPALLTMVALAAAAGAAAGTTPEACWLPIIQPTRTPKKMPATPNTTESLLIAKDQVLRGSTWFCEVPPGSFEVLLDSSRLCGRTNLAEPSGTQQNPVEPIKR